MMYPQMEGKRVFLNAVRGMVMSTQAALAEKVGVTRQTIVAIEQGRYSPSLEVAFRIADAFGKPITEVFTWGDAAGS